MEIKDYTNCKRSAKSYGGSEKKIGVIVNGILFMLKFQKDTPFGLRYNHISEYIGSHVYQMLGIDCQDTYLGTFDGKYVVACKDFNINGYFYVPFNDIGESTIEEDKENFQYSYEDIKSLLEMNKKLTNVEETISSFFDIYIVDAFLGNFDRHGSNWGFLKKDNKYKLAPVFDNGSCLFPSMIDENQMELIMDSKEEIENRVYNFPTSQIKLNGEKSSYFDVISSLKFKEVNEALLRIYPKMDLDKIFAVIDQIPIISEIHKKFYKVILKARFDKIIKCSYLKLIGEKNENI